MEKVKKMFKSFKEIIFGFWLPIVMDILLFFMITIAVAKVLGII
jgi:hypothetical protein